MTLDEIKSFCFDHDEASHAKVQYTSLIKHREEFHVTFMGKDMVNYVQTFDKHGIPIGDIVTVDYDEITIEFDEVMWDGL